ncbi:MAG TPA: Hsp20/alpha crystallin family protein [Bacteroidetes bacterium]|nr:Hsp20/alpha crystallin family protein [Bacteroidota bacterium]
MLPKLRRTETWPSFVDEFFNTDFWPSFMGANTRYNVPAVNILEDDKEYRIEVVAPGIDKKDVKINLEDDVLTISSEREESNEEKDKHYMRREFNYTAFSRSFVVPEEVNAEKISAEHKNGILTLHLPKKEEVIKKTNKREIKVV